VREINHLSLHQWLRSAIPDSQQTASPIGFLFLKLPPPPCAVLLVFLLGGEYPCFTLDSVHISASLAGIDVVRAFVSSNFLRSWDIMGHHGTSWDIMGHETPHLTLESPSALRSVKI